MRHAPSPFAGSRSDYGRPESRKSDPWQSISAPNTIDHAKLKNRAFQCVKDFTIGLLVSQTVESVRQRYTLCSVMPSCLTNRARVWPFPLQDFSFPWFADDYLRGVSFPCRDPVRLSVEKTGLKPGPVFSGRVKNGEHV